MKEVNEVEKLRADFQFQKDRMNAQKQLLVQAHGKIQQTLKELKGTQNALIESEYQTILRHDDIKAFEQRFRPESEMLFGQAYIDRIVELRQILLDQKNKEMKYPNLIINTLAGGSTMEPIVKDWMHKEFYPFLEEMGITTKAYCLGEEIISKLSIELTAGDDPNQLYNIIEVNK